MGLPKTPDIPSMGAIPASPAVEAPPPPIPAASGPLSGGQLDELAAANLRARKALGASKVAAFNGWTAAVLAVLCLPFAIGGPSALIMAGVLACVSWNEFRGRRLVRAFDVRGPRRLGWNQVAFLIAVCLYAAWRIHGVLTGPQLYAEEMERMPQLRPTLGSIGDLQRTITLAVYGGLIVATIIFQGMTAAYYFTRTRHVRAYLAQTPEWVVDLQRRLGAG